MSPIAEIFVPTYFLGGLSRKVWIGQHGMYRAGVGRLQRSSCAMRLTDAREHGAEIMFPVEINEFGEPMNE